MSEGNGYATIDDLLAISQQAKRRYRDVTLPVSGLKVQIQSLTEREKSEFETEALNRSGTGTSLSKVKNARRRFIQKCCVQPRIEPEHIELLGGIDGADLGHLHSVCAEHVGWDEEDISKLEGKSAPSAGDS